MPEPDKDAYRRINTRLDQIVAATLSAFSDPPSLDKCTTLGFNAIGGVRGNRPKDLWCAIFPAGAAAYMPQIYLIVSQHGVELGYAAAIHRRDFSDPAFKKKLKLLAPEIFDALPDPTSDVAHKLSTELAEQEDWYFRRKTRLTPNKNDFGNLMDLLAFLKSDGGRTWGAGTVSRYWLPNELTDLDLAQEFLKATRLFQPLMVRAGPDQGISERRLQSSDEERISGISLGEDEEQAGVEAEPVDPLLKIEQPFDPERIKVRTEPRVVEQVMSRIKHGEIDLAPDFQRLRGVWNTVRKSRLIESLLLRIPLPVFYVAADKSDNWAVVDGLQRFSTMDDFVHNRFRLSSLEYLTQFDGLHFADLPRPMQRRINETQLLIHVIDPGTPEEVMFNIFSRINTGGVRLNGQEIRHALHKGPVRGFLKDLAETEEFHKATDGTVRKERMADRECALRFLAFMIDPWERYSTNDLDGFLGTTMNKINSMDPTDRATLKYAFVRAMSAAYEIFDNDAFRKRYSTTATRSPVSKALFETWSVNLARSSDAEIHCLINRKEDVKDRFIKLMHDDREFDVSISYSTGAPQRVEKRFEAIQSLISEIYS
jgi:hypothetical protein